LNDFADDWQITGYWVESASSAPSICLRRHGRIQSQRRRARADGSDTAARREGGGRRRTAGRRGGARTGSFGRVAELAVLGPGLHRDRIDALSFSPELDAPLSEASDLVSAELARLKPLLDAGDLPAYIYEIQVRCKTASSTVAAEIAGAALRHLRALENESRKLFPKAGLHAIHISDLFFKRAKLPQLLIRLEQDNDLTQQLNASPHGRIEIVDRLFAANDKYVSSLVLQDSFLAPLLGCLPPAFWASSTRRLRDPLVFTLSTVLIDKEGRQPPYEKSPHSSRTQASQ
jgi:hypothetical protein